jgi:NAD(P)H-hydrate epimerase
MKLLTRADSREVDRYAIEELKVPSLVLMENAGRGAAEVLLSRQPAAHKALILCGKGNNGGDGFTMARHLAIRGVEVQVILFASPIDLTGDAKTNYEIAKRIGLPLVDLSSATNLKSCLAAQVDEIDWIVDAMLGTGATGEPREPYHTAIRWANEQPVSKLAVDVPSGLDCDTGQPSSATLCADVTCTFHSPKVGFTQPSAAGFLGELHVISIGIPADRPG